MPTVADTITHPNISPVVLLEVTAGRHVGEWVATSGSVRSFEVAIAEEVTGVKVDGTAIAEAASFAALDANDTTREWFWDGSKLFVNQLTGTSVFSFIYVAELSFYFSTKPKTFNGHFYEPRILSAPNISQRIEEDFGSVGQISGGSLALINNDGFFDGLADLQWNNGRARILFGADTKHETMDFADYALLATWLVEDWRKDDERFTLALKELKSRIDRKAPFNVFSFESHPGIDPGDIGRPIPLAYGVVLGAEPVLIDAGTRTFQLADHAIFRLDQVRIRTDGGWRVANHTGVNLGAATFQLGTEFTGDEEVSVDFIGKPDGSGNPILNASDMVKDILAIAGETDINAASFSAAKDDLEPGTDITTGDPVVIRSPTVWLDEQEDLFDILARINQEVGSYLFINGAGEYVYGVWEPEQGESLDAFDALSILSFREVNTARDIASKVVAKYSERRQDEFFQLIERDRLENRLAAGYPTDLIAEEELTLTDFSDAEYWAERHLAFNHRAARVWEVVLPWTGWLLGPSAQIRLEYDRHNLDVVAEVYETRFDLVGGRVTLRLGNLRGLGDRPGFWVGDADVLPTRFSGLAGYGAGSLVWNAAWASEIKTWVRQNVGYWVDENGFADPDDPDSFIPSVWV